MKSGKSGKPAKKSGSGFPLVKVLIVIGCVAFAAIMIMTSLGTSWLVSMKPAKSGDVAYVDLTLKDEFGRPVFTTNQRIYNATLDSGTLVLLASPMSVPVNITTEELISPVAAFLPGTGQISFAFLGPEYNQIAQGLVGMKEGETKTIAFTNESGYTRVMTPEEFSQMGGNFTEMIRGDQMVLGFTTSPMISADPNETPQYALRTVPITGKTSDNITMDYGYSSADIKILKLSGSGTGSGTSGYL
jgi:hypothetical protein